MNEDHIGDAAGGVLGNPAGLRAEGKADEAVGTVRDAFGGAASGATRDPGGDARGEIGRRRGGAAGRPLERRPLLAVVGRARGVAMAPITMLRNKRSRA